MAAVRKAMAAVRGAMAVVRGAVVRGARWASGLASTQGAVESCFACPVESCFACPVERDLYGDTDEDMLT